MTDNFLIGPIGTYRPAGFLDNAARAEALETNVDFLDSKIGTRRVLRKEDTETTSDMGVKALKALADKGVDLETLDCLIVVTQNPDTHGLPHTSAIIHQKMELPNTCATFDISLGCSGFVYGVAAIKGFMQAIGAKNGALVTADPYSKVMDNDDRNTVLLFGDAACATLISSQIESGWRYVGGRYGSEGSGAEHLCVNEDRILYMNGREVFNFAAKRIPREVKAVFEETGLTVDDIDRFFLHQGSKYIVDALTRRLKFPPEKTPINIGDLGNTISSTIPLLMSEIEADQSVQRILTCGFGVGFSYATAIYERVN